MSDYAKMPKTPRTVEAAAFQALEAINIQNKLFRYVEGLKKCPTETVRKAAKAIGMMGDSVDNGQEALELLRSILEGRP